MIKELLKGVWYFVLLMLGFALVFIIGLRLAPGRSTNAATTAPTTAAATELARYTHIQGVATVGKRQLVHGYDGVSLYTWSTDANGATCIDSINLTAKN